VSKRRRRIQPKPNYSGFISYSWHDKVWGRRLHTWLESYRVPTDVASDPPPPRRLGKFFRDDEDMPAAGDIAAVVRSAIEASENLIVICSPSAARSKWVNAEIEHFRRVGRARQVFAVIVSGTPNSGDPETECFPPALRAASDLNDPNALPIEPMGLDIRRDGRERVCARLAAGILDVDFDTLWQRDRRRATSRQRRVIAGLAILSAVLAMLSAAAINANIRAHAMLAHLLAERAEDQISQNDDEILAAKYALAGLILAPDNAREFGDVLSRAMHEAGESLPPLTHDSQVWTARFSPDGRRLITSSSDKTAGIWDTTNGNLLLRLRGHDDAVIDARFSVDGASAVTASHDRTARLWRTRDGRELAVLKGHEQEVSSAEFSPNAELVVTASNDGTAKIWRASDGAQLANLKGHALELASASFSPDGAEVATASNDHTARIWRVRDGRQIAILKGHAAEVRSAAYSPDGRRVVTASDDETARIWRAADGRLLAVLRGHEGTVYGAMFSPNGQLVVTAGDDGTARLWSVASGRQLKELRGHKGVVWSAQFRFDGARVVTASNDGTAKLWSVADGRELASLHGHVVVRNASFSPGATLIATASQDFTAKVWQANEGRLLGSGPNANLAAEKEWAQPAMRANAPTLAVMADGTAVVRSGTGNRAPVTIGGPAQMITQAALSPDGALVVTMDGGNSAIVWRTRDGRMVSTLSGHTDAVASAAFSADGERVVTASWDGAARVWGWRDGRLLATLSAPLGALTSAAFSPDGERVVAMARAGGGAAWDVHRLTQPLSALSRDACRQLLGGTHRRFTREEIDADSLLRNLWPDAQKDVCRGIDQR
jgi:WD40 repeat protein